MILATSLLTARLIRRRCWTLVLVTACFDVGSPPARAQGVEGGYLPSGGGTFIPFRGGPGGGLGVMPSGPRSPSTGGSPGPSGVMGGAMGAGSTLGSPGGLAPLRPIGVPGAGMGSGGFLGRTPNAAGMGKAMPRPPVGSYPFRIPPSLGVPASARPSMAM